MNTGGRQLEQRRGKRENAQGVCVWQWCIVHFCPALLWEINILSRSPEAEGHYCQTNTHAETHIHTHAHTPCLTDFHLSFCLPLRLFFHCREKTGVNHYRQYRLKMQSPPGAQGHWRPMGGRKESVHVYRRAHTPQQELHVNSLQPVCSLFYSFLILLHSVNLISSTVLISPWPFFLQLRVAWCDFVSFPFPPPRLRFPLFLPTVHPITSLGSSVPVLRANNLIISHFTTQTHEHITDSHELDVFVARVPDPVRWITEWEEALRHCDWMQEKVKNV